MAIIIVFSIILLASLEKNTHDVFQDKLFIDNVLRTELIRRNIDDIEYTMFTIDISLLFIVSVLSYLIAGKTLEPIQENMEIQKRFLGDASHDLRTPLAIMKSESQVLIESKTTDTQEYAKVIQSNLEEIDKMSRLVDDILLVARGDQRINEHSYKRVNIVSVIKHLVDKLQAQTTKKHLTLTYDSPHDIYTLGEIHHLERSIQNIIQNAINYTPEGGSITITTTLYKNSVVTAVKDTGVGISKKDLPHVFDRFYKASHSRNDSSGSGLGLAIARQIIDQHSGKITIQSELGKGTTVSIFLPLYS